MRLIDADGLIKKIQEMSDDYEFTVSQTLDNIITEIENEVSEEHNQIEVISPNELRDYWLYHGLNEKIYDANDVIDSIDNSPIIGTFSEDSPSIKQRVDYKAEAKMRTFKPNICDLISFNVERFMLLFNTNIIKHNKIYNSRGINFKIYKVKAHQYNVWNYKSEYSLNLSTPNNKYTKIIMEVINTNGYT